MTIKLTDHEWDKITEDMIGKTEMLTKEEVEVVATRLNERINIPVLGEGAEQKIFIKIVKKLDRYLYSILPNEI